MKGKDIIREAMRERGVTQDELAKKLGYAYPSGLGNIINRNETMRLTSLTKILSELGYGIVVIDKKTREILGEIDEEKERVVESEKREVLKPYEYGKKNINEMINKALMGKE